MWIIACFNAWLFLHNRKQGVQWRQISKKRKLHMEFWSQGLQAYLEMRKNGSAGGNRRKVQKRHNCWNHSTIYSFVGAQAIDWGLNQPTEERLFAGKIKLATDSRTIKVSLQISETLVQWSIFTGTSFVDIYFKSNNNPQGSGFKCTVSCSTTPPVGKCDCGGVNRPNRIVGGTETAKNEYPWQVRCCKRNEQHL